MDQGPLTGALRFFAGHGTMGAVPHPRREKRSVCGLERNGKVKRDVWGPLSGLADALDSTAMYSR